MKKAGLSIGATGITLVALLVVATNLGLIGVTWPWQKIDLPTVLSEETTLTQTTEATVYSITPIALDCRARIDASVPIEGRREHKVAGQVYRTDKVSMVAQGDIDTCVDSSRTQIRQQDDGAFLVIIPADAITFERPRVDAVATRDSVEFDKGWVGKLTDAFPWVSDNSGLTPAAYSYAQQVVGSSECMERAWDVTETVIKKAYSDQLADQGGERAAIRVLIDGTPDFGDAPGEDIDDFRFELGDAPVNCRVDGGAYSADLLTDSAES